ncbi:MAG: nitrite/sulfite reductase [Phycisphaeraceae bacterium]|nr:nitrite/sulfite reductase [Phycisphaeraceae bacterium]
MRTLDAPEPLLPTPEDQFGETERIKMQSNGVRGNLHADFRDQSRDDLDEASETLAKSHGIYLEYNRAKTGREKDWMYMIRISVPGGGAFTAPQWRAINDAADRYTVNPDGKPSIRLTTRQNIQFHWVRKPDIIPMVQAVAATGFFTLNGCGDNVRNIMGCPLSRFSKVHNAHELARKFALYFRLPAEPHVQVFEIDTSFIQTPDQHYAYADKLLNRKFKFAFSAVHPDEQTGRWRHDNCVELRTNEVGVAPILEHDQVAAYQVYLGGGQGEKFNKPTFAALGMPFGVFTPEQLMPGLDAIVKVHEEYGDRKNRHWARLKYVVHAKGVQWYRDQVRARGAEFALPVPGFDPGPRMLHHGWTKQPSNGLWARGVFIENGRLIDSDNGRLKAMSQHLLDAFPGVELMTTPNQDLLYVNIPEAAKRDFDAAMTPFGYGTRRGKAYSTLRVLSGACVGLPTCRLATADSEQFEPTLIDQLEDLGYGDVKESIGITGCERQCFRPATKSIAWIGQGPQRYALKLGGSEDARWQGQWLSDGEHWYLPQVPRDEVAAVTAVLLEYHRQHRLSEAEDFGACFRRTGVTQLLDHLKQHPTTSPMMEKTRQAPFVPEGHAYGQCS